MRAGIRSWAGLLFVLILLLTGCSADGLHSGGTDGQIAGADGVTKESAEIFAMDTVMELTVYAQEPSEILAEARKLIQRDEALFSVNIEDSDISKLNQAEGKAVEVSAETYELIQKSKGVSERTDGLFDISIYPLVRAWGFTTGEYRVPDEAEQKSILARIDYRRIELLDGNRVRLPADMQVDLGGIAKGYLSGKLVELFREKGAVAAVVSLGGNVQTFGEKPDGKPFTVGITNPEDGAGVLGTIEVEEKAVITSGFYQRYFKKDGVTYHHIMDKRTGGPAQSDLASVTVISDNGEIADGLATALFVMGKEAAIAFDRENEDIQCVLIDTSNEVWASEGITVNR